MRSSAAMLKEQARQLGFNLAGITPAQPAQRLDAYLDWIAAGWHGEMAYLARPDRAARRRDLNVILPGVQSLVVVGLDYRTGAAPPALLANPARGRIAAYAWGADYHELMQGRLEALAGGLGAAGRVYVDTGAVLERAHAQQAGLGFIGKNTLLIHPRRGSQFFLGVLLTTAEFDVYDAPARETQCGTCARCLNACPTQAFPAPYVLDARRCLSYLTIEYKGWIPAELRPVMGNWVFGCDVCQDVCPWQRFGLTTLEPAFVPVSADRAAPPLAELLELDVAGFQARYAGTALARIGRDRLVRNACVAAGNSGRPELIPALTRRLREASPLVRGHAVWALGRLGAVERLAELAAGETDPQVLAEIQQVSKTRN